MSRRIKVADLEMTNAIPEFVGLREYAFLQLLLRWHGRPIGYIKVPVRDDRCEPSEIIDKIVEEHSGGALKAILQGATRHAVPREQWRMADLLKLSPVRRDEILPTISVAVCTRDRPEDLVLCLSALKKLSHQPLEILVIDNAPKTPHTRELVERFFPEVRYLLEPRPGLDWARNRAIAEARGDIIAYTDDDVIVDTHWTKALACVFAEDAAVMAVTGLVVPFELETEPQLWFERYGGFGRGFDRKWYRASETPGCSLARQHAGAGKFGTGANMAYRRNAFNEIGSFDPALDVGTVTQGGGDLDMFFRVLKHGHTLVYEPAAIVRHRHRRDYARLYTQISSNGIGFYAHLVRNALEYPEERTGIFQLGLWWFWHWNVRRWLKSLFKPMDIPQELVTAELRGSVTGLLRYAKSREQAKSVLIQFGPTFAILESSGAQPRAVTRMNSGVAVRTVDLSQRVTGLDDVCAYSSTRVFVTWHGSAVGEVVIANGCQPVSAARLADEILQGIGLRLLDPQQLSSPETLWADSVSELKRFFARAVPPSTRHALPLTGPVSIIIPTRDRPSCLRHCLQSLQEQRTGRKVEIMVVDNNPSSGLTSEVVKEFPNVKLIRESRAGLSYARNTGMAASSGEIVVCVDDDIIASPDWLEQLLEPFSRNDVMLVTGNVFPAELETSAQMQFESYGGLGRGFDRNEYNREWFDSFGRRAVPTWEIGATANAAVRACMLHDPAVGLLDEALGAGTPTGCSEDTYLFYKILKAGHTIVYQPTAFVWHQHRTTDQALETQIFSYSKGHAAYHLTTFLQHGDGRGLVRILIELPRHQLKQIGRWLSGSRARSLRTILLEVVGNFLGPIALWRSRQRVSKLGHSLPYVPLELRYSLHAAELSDEEETLVKDGVEASKV